MLRLPIELAHKVQQVLDEAAHGDPVLADWLIHPGKSGRTKERMSIRYGVMRRLRDLGLSYPQIGKILGVHHSTVVIALQQAGILYRVELPYAVFGIVAEKGVVTSSAPIGAWMMGKKLREVKEWVRNKGGSMHEYNLCGYHRMNEETEHGSKADPA